MAGIAENKGAEFAYATNINHKEHKAKIKKIDAMLHKKKALIESFESMFYSI